VFGKLAPLSNRTDIVRTRVKICGITRIEDAQAAVRAGADAIGLVFDPQSPRYVTRERAAGIASTVGPFVTVVGLFVDATPEVIHETLSRVPVTLLQFHGSETPDQCVLYELPYIKAVRMRNDVDVQAEAAAHGHALALLLDTFVPQVAGGSGHAFDWKRIPPDLTKPVIVAGGLSSANVGEAIRAAHPYAVDVSSGVEMTKGIKDPAKIAAFMQAVRDAA
jgi:phosphoribosylanthranilate isomerase